MSLILHQYASSPFSEKVRLIFGAKRLSWTAVKIPVVNPKPDLVALTGGYRKTPVLQIGADIWCDTALIARVLDRLQPEPPLAPASAPLAPLLAQWADSTLFWTVVPHIMRPAGAAVLFAGLPPEAMQAFAADRAAMTAGMKRIAGADATVQLDGYLAALEGQLADGRAFLFGTAPTIADFSVAHSLWFMRRAGPQAAPLQARAALSAWLDRMLDIGHGQRSEMDSAQAIEVARSGTRQAVVVEPGLGYAAGAAVTVAAMDYGSDPVAGRLVGLGTDEVVIERDDERAGRVQVHFPRIGFQIKDQIKVDKI